MSEFDYRRIADALQSRKDELLPRLRSAVHASLASLEPSEALTLRLMNGDAEVRRLKPAASSEYAGALISFCREKTYNGYTVDSGVTPRVVAVVEDALLSFYTSESVGSAVADAVLEEIRGTSAVTRVVQEEMASNHDWMVHEIKTLASLDTATSIAGQLADATAQQVHHFFQTAVGKQIVLVIGKVMATSAGRTLVVKTVQIAIAKVMASAALKTALLATIKKVGIGILIKTVIGKALVALLALVGIAHVPIAWVILPILAGFLAYEYMSFPAKLAERVPAEVVSVIDGKFGELNDSIARSIVGALFDEVVRELTRLREVPA